MNLPTSEKKYMVQIIAANRLSFLDMNMSWSPKGDLEFGIFRKKGSQLKYIGKHSNHTPGTKCIIPSGFLNCLEKLT